MFIFIPLRLVFMSFAIILFIHKKLEFKIQIIFIIYLGKM